MALLLSLVVLFSASPSAAQTAVVRPEKPIDCETFQAHLDHVIIEWTKQKESHLILIARLGTGEKDHRLNRARLAYVEDYLKSHKVQYVLAEGTKVKGLGRLEVYVSGRLAMSIPIIKGARRLCWGSNGA
jgi:hypothetical protein